VDRVRGAAGLVFQASTFVGASRSRLSQSVSLSLGAAIELVAGCVCASVVRLADRQMEHVSAVQRLHAQASRRDRLAPRGLCNQPDRDRLRIRAESRGGPVAPETPCPSRPGSLPDCRRGAWSAVASAHQLFPEMSMTSVASEIRNARSALDQLARVALAAASSDGLAGCISGAELVEDIRDAQRSRRTSGSGTSE